MCLKGQVKVVGDLGSVVGDAGDVAEVWGCIADVRDVWKTTNIVKKCWAFEGSRRREGRIMRVHGIGDARDVQWTQRTFRGRTLLY